MSGARAHLVRLRQAHDELIARTNAPEDDYNGVVRRYRNPILTRHHAPLEWRFDLDPETNPLGLERMGVNAVFNPGAIFWDGRYVLVARVESSDRKSFFALASSETPTEKFRFHDEPILLPQTDDPETNVYDMRLTPHEDGWIYGTFCAERKDTSKSNDPSAAVAACGIVRTKDLESWERLPDLVTPSPQQRNVVLHPELIDGRYLLYTRPQDGFIAAGSGGGIGYGFADTMDGAVVEEERVLDPRVYHTIKEAKNGLGPAPIRTEAGWLHLAHGVRNTAAGLRYVLYVFMTDLDEPWRVTHRPGGHVMAPEGDERVGDVSNVLFSNGWIADSEGRVFIYYASSDTRVHVAESSVERLVDYCRNTPEDSLTSRGSVEQRLAMIRRNRGL